MNYLVSIVFLYLFVQTSLGQSEISGDDDSNDVCLKDIDLMIVLDGSYSVTHPNFEIVKNWVKKLADALYIDGGHVHIGVVQYSHYYPNRPLTDQRYIKTEIELGEFKNHEQFDNAVDAIKYQGFKTYTAHALEKTLDVDFVGPNSRYPQAQRILILLTDGRATDSEHLPPVIKRMEAAGITIYAVGVGNFDAGQLHLITNNHTGRVFQLKSFDDLHQIVQDLQKQLQTSCDCVDEGTVVGSTCDQCTAQCVCKVNVMGRRCDECEDDHYGFGRDYGCLPCGCNIFGSLNSTCDSSSGVCACRPMIEGRQCDGCAVGHFGFPKCKPCDCGVYSKTCDSDTGVCLNCQEGRRGDHCEICPIGYYMESGDCVPCSCNGNNNLSDPSSCDPLTGLCSNCLRNTGGDHCEKCQKHCYGDALTQSCQRCACDLTGTVQSSCEDSGCNCSATGACSCLPNVEGKTCDRCSAGYWQMQKGRGCIKCQCNKKNIVLNTTCDQVSGICECKTGYAGKTCDDCANGYEILNGNCVNSALLDGRRNEKTTTPPPTTTVKRRKPLPVNPGWSPCVGCGGQKWPSYCRGWTCRTRYPYSSQTPSSRRCYSWDWSCRNSVESYRYNTYNNYYQPSSYNYDYYNWMQPNYYRGYYRHPRSYRSTHGRRSFRYNRYHN